MGLRQAVLGIVALLAIAPALADTFETRPSPRLPTSAQGHVVSYAVDGKQYIAVESGLGGSSVMPGVHHPNNGNTILVFALPEN